MKSYSSKYKKLKEHRNPKATYRGLLPIKLQKAAVTIQRFWRRRMLLRSKLYAQLQYELDSQIALLMFENQSLENIIGVYDKNCQMIQTSIMKKAQRQTEADQKECNAVIKELVSLTLHM